ncbi:hypothetical protein LTR85_005495 [Meristemomyces frigidus]|nr:hypothetical protein LTR85_005495 [Meristemomyces frigidus]
MAPTTLPRLAFRQSRWALQKRAASTTTEAAQNTASSGAAKAKEGASQAAGKAQQGLSRVTSSAGSTMSSAASRASAAVSGIGGRTGQAISFVQSLIPPTIYYARVGGELMKLMFQGRNMYPPNMQTVQSYLTPMQNALRNPSALLNRSATQAGAAVEKTAESTAQTAMNNPETFLTRLRNFDASTMTTVAVVTAEVIGFFSVGEMIGRFKVIGYRGDPHGEHH